MIATADIAQEDQEAEAIVQTQPGRSGHAIWGPYERLPAGRYAATFRIRLVGPPSTPLNVLCALADVAIDCGREAVAYDFVFAHQLTGEFREVVLPFALDREAVVEYRVYTDGSVPLEIAETRTVVRLADDASTTIEPEAGLPHLLVGERPETKKLYESGVALSLVDGHLHGTLDGVTFRADRRDDVNFIDELFFKKAYNFLADFETCVVDVGMNVGLASLLFADKPGVREVHAFEPFPETYARATANLALNPALADRIEARNHGLGDGNADTTFLVGDTGGDSGGQATRSVVGGTPVRLSIRDAGEILRPLLVSAGRRGLSRVVKIDCEGAEFDIFRSLTRADLWHEIDMLMVEWHRVFAGRDQGELIAPLRAAGFMVVDLTPPSGNGFFYAHRMPVAGRTPKGSGPLRRAVAALIGPGRS